MVAAPRQPADDVADGTLADFAGRNCPAGEYFDLDFGILRPEHPIRGALRDGIADCLEAARRSCCRLGPESRAKPLVAALVLIDCVDDGSVERIDRVERCE